jgi:hypothetical protein
MRQTVVQGESITAFNADALRASVNVTLGLSMSNSTVIDTWEAVCFLCLERLKATGYKIECLPQDEAEVVALWRLEADGYNGGFIQFFCNWGEKNCATAINALRRIGATNTLNIVQKQRNMVDRFGEHPEMTGYWDIPKLMTDDEAKIIEEQLDPELWKAAEEIQNLAAPIYEHIINRPA